MKCGLLGEKLGHSYSPQIHGFLGNYAYDLYEKQPDELELFLRQGDFTGLNVTMPYKKTVMSYCDALSPVAQKLKAVNTIVRRADGSLIGHNTDYFGFHSMVQRTGLQVAGKKVLVLGNGGASATAVAVLKEQNANVVVISRSGENNYENLHVHADASVIVNATPVGMYPKTGISPVNLNLFPHLTGVLDIVYNPARTQLLMDAEKRGLVTENGLWMLVAQATESAQWFTGKEIPMDKIAWIHQKLQKQMENIILIGMPGCGKSTIGRVVAQKCDKRFVDADEAIKEKAGMEIPAIFEKYGESGFRAIESKVLDELGKQSGLVIATGGGCVTVERNYDLLHQNGRIIWIQRAIEKLTTEGRPLSAGGKLQQMYKYRGPLYQKFADTIVQNDGTIEETVDKILYLEAMQ